MANRNHSAGVLVYRMGEAGLEVLIVHPGGPLWANKDEGAWSIPKGEVGDGEEAEATARRELLEEVGIAAEELAPLGSITQKAGKTVVAWATEADFDPDQLSSNTFTMEWPPRSGRIAEFPEVDRVMWASPTVAANKLNPAQVDLVDRLVALLETP